ncbi:MAG: acyltransferase family protein, partial [Chitinophagales bacterium]
GYNYHETASPWAYIFFWSNFYIVKYGFPYSPVLAVLWTVSVEEQFYIVMPWLMKFFKKWRVQILVIIILISIGFRIYYRNDGFTMFFHTLCIMSDFAVGALIAWLAVNEHALFFKWKSVPRKISFIVYLAVLIMIVFYHPIFDSTVATIAERLILGVGFGYVIFDQAFGERKVFEMSHIPGFIWLGKRAYGIYCFHQFGILASIKILRAIHLIQSPIDYLVLLPVLSFVLTVIMAALSYRFFERPFMNWKEKFEMKSEVQPS